MVRGTALSNLGRRADGMRSCDRAIECDASYVPAYLSKAVDLAMDGRREDAIACCDAALENCPAGQSGRFERGMATSAREMVRDWPYGAPYGAPGDRI